MQSFSLLFDTNDIEHDGRMLGRARDPPGQSSVYIPPGELKTRSLKSRFESVKRLFSVRHHINYFNLPSLSDSKSPWAYCIKFKFLMS